MLDNPQTIYLIGFYVALIAAVLWSFVFDKNKPPTIREFIAKLIARGVFIGFVYFVIVGFVYFALGTGYGS